MTRNEFEKAAREQNERREAEVAKARENRTACDVEVMLAFGGETFCRTHRVVGPCPYGPNAGVSGAASSTRGQRNKARFEEMRARDAGVQS